MRMSTRQAGLVEEEEEDIYQKRSSPRVRELGVSNRVTYTVYKWVNKRATEQDRGGMFVLLALCFLSVGALLVEDCWQGPWTKLQCLGEHILCSSLCSLKHKHTSQQLQFFVLLNPIFCSWFFISWLLSCHTVLDITIEREGERERESVFPLLKACQTSYAIILFCLINTTLLSFLDLRG